MPESFDSQRVAPAVLSTPHSMYWSVRRELWENRYLYIAPVAVAAVALFGFLVATLGRSMSVSDLDRRRAILLEPYSFVMGLIMATTFVIGIFYSLDALHGERRDRSILFWKSLPVSDLTTVLSKASIPLAVLPLLTFGLVVIVQLTMMLLSSLVLVGSGLSLAPFWIQSSLIQMALLLLYHLVTIHILWHAPIYGWLLLVSGWARRAAFLWASLPLLVIGGFEKMVFHTSHFANILGYRFTGGPEAISAADGMPIDPMTTHLTPLRFLASPSLWSGLLFAALCLGIAVRVRHYREPI